jgi:hypothetical protein
MIDATCELHLLSLLFDQLKQLKDSIFDAYAAIGHTVKNAPNGTVGVAVEVPR